MKTFNQFITEAYDHDIESRSQITKQGEGGRIGRKRKQTDAEKKRVRAVGGGKTVPAKTYKDKADIGKTNKKRSPAGRQQQPTQQRGSAALSAKEAQKKAYLERKKKSAVKDEASGKDKKIDLKKSADKLLSKKPAGYVEAGRKRKLVKKNPNYKPPKATGYTTPERQKITRAGERLVKDIKKGKEKPASQYDPGIRKG